jgi:hypothetical protein
MIRHEVFASGCVENQKKAKGTINIVENLVKLLVSVKEVHVHNHTHNFAHMIFQRIIFFGHCPCLVLKDCVVFLRWAPPFSFAERKVTCGAC